MSVATMAQMVISARLGTLAGSSMSELEEIVQ
jgi:hypothetical protein